VGANNSVSEDSVVNFFVSGRIQVGYEPGPAKSLHTISLNSFNVVGSMFSSLSKYWHASFSIWLISLSWNIPCAMIDHDLFEYASTSQMSLAGQHECGYEETVAQ